MKRLRIKALFLTMIVTVCIFSISLIGCGEKKAVQPAAQKAAVFKTQATQTKTEAPKPSTAPITEERTFYDFEDDIDAWEIPMWALGKSDYIAKDAVHSTEVASKGKGSLKVSTDYTGGRWLAALVEIQQYLNLSKYRVISADLYLPPDAPKGIKVKVILTVGDNWKFVEMARSIPLIPGEWTTITANIEPGSYDWKRVVPDEEFAEDVRKISLRIVSNHKPKYTGPIYIDNVRVGR
jgi:predicted small lipoprotein YifL